MRRFWLKKNNKIWDLTTENESIINGNFFGGPEGLGVKLKIESYEIEHAFFVENVKMESTEISGKLYFSDYVHFSNFIEFIGYIETNKPMRLYYSTNEVANYESEDEWYKLVLIKELTKTEVEFKTGCLICNVKFAALSPWKKDRKFAFELDTDRFSDPNNGRPNVAVNIDNSGNLPTPCTIKIEGITDTPEFYILQNDEIIERGRYNTYINKGCYMLINSDPLTQEASLYTESKREDIYLLGERDYSYSNFLTIPSGKSMFLLIAQNKSFGRVTLTYSVQRELI